MNIVLCDNGLHLKFAPLTLTRPLGDLRVGMYTNTERWKKLIPSCSVFFETEEYLSVKFPLTSKEDIKINAAIIPSLNLVDAILTLKDGEELFFGDDWIAKKGLILDTRIDFKEKLSILKERWDLFQLNEEILVNDFKIATKNQTSQKLSNSNTLIGDSKNLFIEEGAKIEASILNCNEGPIYICKDAEIMEGAMIRGPFYLGEHATVKMGAKIYGATSIGPHCKVGGELSNVLFQGFSNKGHDGFLGNSCIGEWCNLGADTNSSNLKNNYSKVTAYSFESKSQEKTDVQFMGLIMGDHSKCGINTMFNTATIVGVSANIYGGEFPPKYIPSFSWGGSHGFVPFDLNKAVKASEAMMNRRNIDFTEGDLEIFKFLAEKK